MTTTTTTARAQQPQKAQSGTGGQHSLEGFLLETFSVEDFHPPPPQHPSLRGESLMPMPKAVDM